MIEVEKLNPLNRSTRGEFLSLLKSSNFTAVSGHVFFDHNGDRSLDFSIINFQYGRFVRIGTVDLEGRVTYFNNVSILYMGGTREKPRELAVKQLIEILFFTAMMIICVSLTIVFLCVSLAFFVCYHRKHPVIKGSSFIFLVLMLLRIACLSVSMIPRSLENIFPSSEICILKFAIMNIGYAMIMSTLMVRVM